MKLLSKLSFLLLSLTLLLPLSANAQFENWKINSFDSVIEIQEDSSVIVNETLIVDFSKEPHHGIFRRIPYLYTGTDGNEVEVRIKVLSVTDLKGNDLNYTTSTIGNDYEIKIGDEDILINEIFSYQIKYSFSRGVNFFKDDHAELYWNVTGDNWPVPIITGSASIILPNTTNDLSALKATCYTGVYGSTLQNCTSIVENNGNTFNYSTSRPINPGENFTIVAGFPKELVNEPSQFEKFLWWIQKYIWYFIPFFVLVYLTYRWYTKGRDPEKRGTIIPYYKPPKELTPSEVGTLIDEKAHIEDITAAIISFAVRGYIKIKEIEKNGIIFKKTDHELELVKEDYKNDKKLKEHEIKILDAIFEGDKTKKLSELNNNFYKHLQSIKDSIYNSVVKEGLFPINPENVRNAYIGIGITVIIISIILSLTLIKFYTGEVIYAGVSTGIIFLIFSSFMPAKTPKGTKIYEELLGLKMYIKTAEKDRIKFFEKDIAKENKKFVFEQILPYALVLGVGEYWAKAFEGIYKEPPNWYQGRNYPSFTTLYLFNSLNSLSKASAASFTSRPSSAASGGSGFGGGGGFSGGGFGGGGGGSW